MVTSTSAYGMWVAPGSAIIRKGRECEAGLKSFQIWLSEGVLRPAEVSAFCRGSGFRKLEGEVPEQPHQRCGTSLYCSTPDYILSY